MMEDTNSRLYIDLGRLLSKNRPAHRRLAVEEILSGELPLYKKIEAIEKLDGTPHRRNAGDEGDADFTAPPMAAEDEQEDAAARDRIALNNRSKIKAPLQRSALFSFLFKELFLILKNYGPNSDHMTVRFSLIPLSVSMNPELQQLINDNYINSASELQKFLSYAAQNGWQYLSKFEYNLLVLFGEMCRKLASLNPRLFVAAKPFNSDKFCSFERLYLACRKEDHYPQMIVQAMQTVATKSSEYSNAVQLHTMLTHKILFRVTRPGMQEILAAINSVFFRKQIFFSSLYRSSSVPVIPSNDFDCPAEVRKNINIFIEQQKKRIIEFENELSSVLRFEEHLRFKPDNTFDFTLLRHYYEKAHKNTGFEESGSCPPLFTLKILQLFLTLFEAPLNGEIHISKGKTLQLFVPELFQFELNKIRSCAEKLARLHYAHKNIDRERFALLLNSLKSGTEGEIELMQLIGESVDALFFLAEKLVNVQRFHSAGEEKPVDAAMITTRKLCVPGYYDELDHPLFRGMTVRQFLHEICSVSLLFAAFMNDKRLSSLLSQKEKLSKDLEATRESFCRVATERTVSEFYSAFGLRYPPVTE